MALRSFVPVALMAAILLHYSMWSLLNQRPNGGPDIGDWMRVFAVLLVPLLTGIQFGRRSRGQRVRAVTTAVLFIATATYLLGLVLPGTDASGMRPFLWQMELAYWLPLGSIGAAAAGTAAEAAQRRKLRRLAG